MDCHQHTVSDWTYDPTAPGLYSGPCISCGAHVRATGEREYGIEWTEHLIGAE